MALVFGLALYVCEETIVFIRAVCISDYDIHHRDDNPDFIVIL